MNAGRWIVLGILLGVSYVDIRARRVPVYVFWAGIVMVLLYRVFCQNISLWELLMGLGPGILFLFVSRVTREGIGYGDSWGILILGGYLSFGELLEVLMTAFILMAVYAVILLSLKKMSRKCKMPFFPFLTCGYTVLLLTEGGIL